jgi:hypothetical protein
MFKQMEDNMGDLFKIFLLLLFVFFLVNNSKASKPGMEEGVFEDNGFSGGSEYSYVLPGE